MQLGYAFTVGRRSVYVQSSYSGPAFARAVAPPAMLGSARRGGGQLCDKEPDSCIVHVRTSQIIPQCP